MDATSSFVQQPARCSGYRTGLLGSRFNKSKLGTWRRLAPSIAARFPTLIHPILRFESKTRQDPKNKRCSLGMLDVLPLEIRDKIFRELDVASLVVIRARRPKGSRRPCGVQNHSNPHAGAYAYHPKP